MIWKDSKDSKIYSRLIHIYVLQSMQLQSIKNVHAPKPGFLFRKSGFWEHGKLSKNIYIYTFINLYGDNFT